MQNVYIARQPISDKNKAIYACERLSRDGAANCVPDIDGDVANTTLLANTFFLIAMSRLAEGKPNELIRVACIRGRFCELLGAEAVARTSPPEMFTLGMFSLIDAVIDHPMDNVLEALPLSGQIKRALVDQ